MSAGWRAVDKRMEQAIADLRGALQALFLKAAQLYGENGELMQELGAVQVAGDWVLKIFREDVVLPKSLPDPQVLESVKEKPLVKKPLAKKKGK